MVAAMAAVVAAVETTTAAEMRRPHATAGLEIALHRVEVPTGRATRATMMEVCRIAAMEMPVVRAATIVEAAIVAPIAIEDRAVIIVVETVIGDRTAGIIAAAPIIAVPDAAAERQGGNDRRGGEQQTFHDTGLLLATERAAPGSGCVAHKSLLPDRRRTR